MAIIILTLLFLGTGALAIWYYQFVPSGKSLRERLPNKISFAALLLTAVIIFGGWYATQKFGGRFDRVSAVTTLVFFLLTFESFLLLIFKWLRSNTLAVIMALVAAAIPFTLQFSNPSYAYINTIIIAATIGATTLLIRVSNIPTRIIIILAILLSINDIFVVQNITARLPYLSPIADAPLRLLIFPTLVAFGRVVGSGDVMFLTLTTLVLLRDLGRNFAWLHVAVQSAALAIALFATQDKDILFPYLTIMTPIFLTIYIFGRQQKRRA